MEGASLGPHVLVHLAGKRNSDQTSNVPLVQMTAERFNNFNNFLPRWRDVSAGWDWNPGPSY